MTLEPTQTRYPITIEIEGAGNVTVERNRQIYQHIQLKLTHIAGADFCWVTICDCPEGFWVDSATCYGGYVHKAAKAWIANWDSLRYGENS